MITEMSIQKPDLKILERAGFQTKNNVPIFFIGDYELTFEDLCEDFSDCVTALDNKLFFKAKNAFVTYMCENYEENNNFTSQDIHNCKQVFSLIINWFYLPQLINSSNEVTIAEDKVPPYFKYILQAIFTNAKIMNFQINENLKNYIKE